MSEEQNQEKAYEVKDKRRVNADGSIREEADAPEEQPEQGAPEEHEDEAQEAHEHHEHHEGHEHHEHDELPVPSVFDVLQFTAGMLAEQAWSKMGIRLAPGQKELSKDLVQAKLAIDTVVFIADKLHPHVGEDERRALRALVSDLQVNFVRQSS